LSPKRGDLSSGPSWDVFQHILQSTLRVPQVEGALHVDPKLWTVSAVGAKPNRHLGRDGTLPAPATLTRIAGSTTSRNSVPG